MIALDESSYSKLKNCKCDVGYAFDMSARLDNQNIRIIKNTRYISLDFVTKVARQFHLEEKFTVPTRDNINHS